MEHFPAREKETLWKEASAKAVLDCQELDSSD